MTSYVADCESGAGAEAGASAGGGRQTAGGGRRVGRRLARRVPLFLYTVPVNRGVYMTFKTRIASACLIILSSFCVISGSALRSPVRERATPAGEVVVVLSEQFLSSIIEAIAAQPSPPSYKLSREGEGSKNCADQVTLLPESQGTRTTIRFEEGRIIAPVAFRGSYEPPLLGCMNFEGWADTSFDFAFDPAQQSLNARIRVRSINLKSVPSMMSGGITGLVQDAIDSRVNPIVILRAEQLGATLPASNRGLRLRAKEVRHEVAGKDLRIRIVYEILQSD